MRRAPQVADPAQRRRQPRRGDHPAYDAAGLLAARAALDPRGVIMCSALGQESKVLESIKAGARDFVVKPFQADRVIEAVGKALA